MVNVALHLAALAVSEPQRLAVVFPQGRGRKGRAANTQLTFQQLHDLSDRLAYGLQSIGLNRGVRIALMTPPSLDFFVIAFALFKLGAVPILIDPGMGIRNLGRCLAEAGPFAFIGVPKAHLARKLFRWAHRSIQITVTTGRFGGRYTLSQLLRNEGNGRIFPIAATPAEETAAILFTSGSTGVAKGVVYTHDMFHAQIEILRSTFGIKPGEIDLSTFPLFALFGPALGMTAIIPDMNPTRPAQVDPRKIIAAIDDFGVTNLFGSPALLDRVGRFGERNSIRFPTLKRVISAGAPVPAKVVERFASLLEKSAQVHTPYGATEALPVASIDSDALRQTRPATERGCGICVGHPLKQLKVRIIPIEEIAQDQWDDARCLGANQIGEIVVSGSVVSAAYFNRPQANQLAKINDKERGTLWHRMGDLGYLDDEGRLWFCGRKSQRVVTSRGTLFTIPCEAVFNAHPAVYRTAIVGIKVGNDVRPVLCVELEKTAKTRAWSDIERELRQIALNHPHTQTLSVFLEHSSFPVDIRHNAKIFREKLAVWAARQLKRQRWPTDRAPIAAPPSYHQRVTNFTSEKTAPQASESSIGASIAAPANGERT